MGYSQSVIDNEEAWEHGMAFPDCVVNPFIDPPTFQNMLNKTSTNIIKCGTPIPKSNSNQPYLAYKGYCWIFLATPNNTWGTAGLFPLKKFKKLLDVDPIYQIPNNDNYNLSQLCKKIIYDTYKIYRIIAKKPGIGISLVDLVPFQYKYTPEEKIQHINEINDSLNYISNNIDRIKDIREKCRTPNNLTSPFFSHEDAKSFDRGIEFMQNFKKLNNPE